MSGAGFTECSVVARITSAIRTAATAADDTKTDRFAMRSPRAGLRASKGNAGHVPARKRRPVERDGRVLKRRRSGRFTHGRTEWIADAVALHAPPERDARDTERGRRALPVPAMVLEHAQDARALVAHKPAAVRARAGEDVAELRPARTRQNAERLER